MPLTRRRATIWAASDGKTFTDFKQAAAYERDLEIRDALEQIIPSGMCKQEMIDFIIAERGALLHILGKSDTAMKREAMPANTEVDSTP